MQPGGTITSAVFRFAFGQSFASEASKATMHYPTSEMPSIRSMLMLFLRGIGVCLTRHATHKTRGVFSSIIIIMRKKQKKKKCQSRRRKFQVTKIKKMFLNFVVGSTREERRRQSRWASLTPSSTWPMTSNVVPYCAVRVLPKHVVRRFVDESNGAFMQQRHHEQQRRRRRRRHQHQHQ